MGSCSEQWAWASAASSVLCAESSGLLVVLEYACQLCRGFQLPCRYSLAPRVHVHNPHTAQAQLRAGAELPASVRAVTRLGHSREGGGNQRLGTREEGDSGPSRWDGGGPRTNHGLGDKDKQKEHRDKSSLLI